MSYKILIIFFIGFLTFISQNYAQVNANIEIFDVQKGKVIKSVPANDFTQQEANKLIHNIKSIYVKVTPIPKKGVMVKIPLQPSIHVKNKWIDTYTNEVIVIFPQGEKPFLMLFDEENYPYFFNFTEDTDQLLKYLDLKL